MASLLLAVIYISFISLGLPDALLGAAWPTMYPEFGVPLSYAGIISVIISCGTISSSLLSDRMTRRFGTGNVMVVSVAMTALALFGFSASRSFWMLCLLAVPYGLGAGGVDASLNNYVALHYASRHMSWLHCMWGVGASVGPYIMSYALLGGMGWNKGYLYIAVFQMILTAVLLISLPAWKKRSAENQTAAKALPLSQVLRIRGAKEIMLAFFCYCALEQMVGLWASSYLVMKDGLSADEAAGFASLFYIGITAGRAIGGFLTYRFNDTQMIRLGEAVLAIGVVVMLLPFGRAVSMTGLVLIGLGCAPIYPSVIHSTPDHFGAENSQAIIGVQMASAYIGSLLMPPVFGLIANHIGVGLLPVVAALVLALMAWMNEKLNKLS